MTPGPKLSSDFFETPEKQRAEQIYQEFEEALRADSETRLADYACQLPESRPEMLVELVAIEMEHRRQRGERCTTEDYTARFPQLAKQPAFEELFVQARTGMAGKPAAAAISGRPIPGDLKASERYQVRDKEIGKGGLGRVREAFDRELGRIVAYKEILPQLARRADVRQSFSQEVQLLSRLQHPGILPVYNYGITENGTLFYTMPFVEGDTLKAAIRHLHAVPNRKQKFVRKLTALTRHFVDLCYAVEYAHSQGVLHRDLKPENVLIGKFGETFVIDFGLGVDAWFEMQSPEAAGCPPDNPPRPFMAGGPPPEAHAAGAFSQLPAAEMEQTPPAAQAGIATPMGTRDETLISLSKTRTAHAAGTLPYASPEQFMPHARSVSHLSDVYSLGVTLYELIVGCPAFDCDTFQEAEKKILAGDFKKPREVKPHIPPALEAICLKAMAHDPAVRYPSARALALDIGHWQANDRVSAHKEGLWHQAQRVWSKYRQACLSAGLALIAVLAVLLGAWLLINRIADDYKTVSGQLSGAQAQLTQIQVEHDQTQQELEDLVLQRNELMEQREKLLTGLRSMRKELQDSKLQHATELAKEKTAREFAERSLKEAQSELLATDRPTHPPASPMAPEAESSKAPGPRSADPNAGGESHGIPTREPTEADEAAGEAETAPEPPEADGNADGEAAAAGESGDVGPDDADSEGPDDAGPEDGGPDDAGPDDAGPEAERGGAQIAEFVVPRPTAAKTELNGTAPGRLAAVNIEISKRVNQARKLGLHDAARPRRAELVWVIVFTSRFQNQMQTRPGCVTISGRR